MEYALHVIVLLLIQCVLTISLDLVLVQTGFFTLAHALHFGVGAYAAALAMKSFAMPVAVAFPLAALFAMLSSVFVWAAMERMAGDLFTITTIALQVLFTSLMTNLEALTGGPFGLRDIPQPVTPEAVRPVFATGMLLFVAICWQLRSFALSRPLGHALLAVRNSPEWVAASGVSPSLVKAVVCALSAGVAGIAGASHALYFAYIDPFNFTLAESITASTALLVGGIHRRWAPVTGAMFVVLFPEALRFTGLSSPQIAYTRQLFIGIVLIATAVAYRASPRLMGERQTST